MRGIAFALALLVAVASPAHADEPGEPTHDKRVPLGESFTRAELTALGVVLALDLALVAFQDAIVDRLGPPSFGPPPGIDVAISDALDQERPYLRRIPDRLGQLVLPMATGAFYVSDALLVWVRGRGWAGDLNADHELLAFLEAFGATVLVNQTAKLAIGRWRPEIELRGRDPATDDEATLSFFSLHSSSSFCIAAFVSRDLGDHLARRGAGVFWARIVPSAALYGLAAWIGYSRIVDQRHYFTDVLTGALVGTAAGNLAYSFHFDSTGRPRRRHKRVDLHLTAFPGGMAVGGSF